MGILLPLFRLGASLDDCASYLDLRLDIVRSCSKIDYLTCDSPFLRAHELNVTLFTRCLIAMAVG